MADPPDRIQLVDVMVDRGVTVRLRLGDRIVGATSDDDGRDAAARATLAAIGQLTPSTLELTLDSVRTLPPTPGVRSTVVVAVVVVTVAGVPLPHSGSALVKDGNERATAAAVLDALNRRVQILGI